MSKRSEAGKGSTTRLTDKTIYDENDNRIWGKKKTASIRGDVYYDSDSDNINDVRYDLKYMPTDHYEE
jgi:hypothetical protein